MPFSPSPVSYAPFMIQQQARAVSCRPEWNMSMNSIRKASCVLTDKNSTPKATRFAKPICSSKGKKSATSSSAIRSPTTNSMPPNLITCSLIRRLASIGKRSNKTSLMNICKKDLRGVLAQVCLVCRMAPYCF